MKRAELFCLQLASQFAICDLPLSPLLHIPGSHGEGGGQVLRTSLALSLILQRPFEITDIRANRDKPGLQRQHLASVLAAAQVGKAAVEGAALGSQRLRFYPTTIRAGEHHFDIGTAGSTTLVLQTILPPLLYAGAPARITITGGTHNPKAPSTDFLQRTFLPILERMGAPVTLSVERRGFYPRGGGRIVCDLPGLPDWTPLDLTERGELTGLYAAAIVSALPVHIAQRELDVLQKSTRGPWRDARVIEEPNPAGPGNALVFHLQHQHVGETITALGERGLAAEQVARHAHDEAQRYIDTRAPVGEHLADQLMLPLLLAGGRCVTGPLSTHSTTNLETIAMFLGGRPLDASPWTGNPPATVVGCTRPLVTAAKQR